MMPHRASWQSCCPPSPGCKAKASGNPEHPKPCNNPNNQRRTRSSWSSFMMPRRASWESSCPPSQGDGVMN